MLAPLWKRQWLSYPSGENGGEKEGGNRSGTYPPRNAPTGFRGGRGAAELWRGEEDWNDRVIGMAGLARDTKRLPPASILEAIL